MSERAHCTTGHCVMHGTPLRRKQWDALAKRVAELEADKVVADELIADGGDLIAQNAAVRTAMLEGYQKVTADRDEQAARIRALETALNNAADHAKAQEARIKALEDALKRVDFFATQVLSSSGLTDPKHTMLTTARLTHDAVIEALGLIGGG